jgi:hypothetical protein
LYCLFVDDFDSHSQEIDPAQEIEEKDILGMGGDEFSIFKDLAGSLPGIDEAMGFGEVMKYGQ